MFDPCLLPLSGGNKGQAEDSRTSEAPRSRGAFPFASNGQQEAAMKIQEGGNEHSIGDKNCPGCESPEGEQFPQPHRDPVTNCLGLVHAEIFAEESKPSAGEAVLYRCDVCGGSI